MMVMMIKIRTHKVFVFIIEGLFVHFSLYHNHNIFIILIIQISIIIIQSVQMAPMIWCLMLFISVCACCLCQCQSVSGKLFQHCQSPHGTIQSISVSNCKDTDSACNFPKNTNISLGVNFIPSKFFFVFLCFFFVFHFVF